MLLTLILAIPLLLIVSGIGYTALKVRARQRQDANPAQWPTSDQALQFYGLSNSCISHKSGSASIIVGVEGFDLESADDLTKLKLVNELAETIRTITANRGGDADAGVSLAFYSQAGELDLTEMIEGMERALENTAEPGIAAQTQLDIQFLQEEAAVRPFTQARFAVVITLSAASIRKEMQAAQSQLLSESLAESETEYSSSDAVYQLSLLAAPTSDRRLTLTLPTNGYGNSAAPSPTSATATATGPNSRKVTVAGWDENDEDSAELDNARAEKARIEAEAVRRLRLATGEITQQELEAEQAEESRREKARQLTEKEKAKLYRPSLWRRFLNSLGESVADVQGSLAAAQVELGGSIAGHPVPQAVAEVLVAKAAAMQAFCAQFAMAAHVLDHEEAYELIASSLYLPKRPPAYYEAVIRHELRCVRSINRLIEANPGLPLRDLEAVIAMKLEELEQAERQSRAAQRQAASSALASLLTDGVNGSGAVTYASRGQDGTLQPPVDVSAFGTAPLDFEVDYVKIGVAPQVAELQARLREEVEYFKSGSRQPYAAVKFIKDIVENTGRLQSWPRESYLTTLYVTEWPNAIPMGLPRPLLVQPGLELSFTVNIKTYNKKKAQKSLKRAQKNVQMGMRIDKKRDDGDRALVATAAAQLRNEVIGTRGIINMVGTFIVVRADSPALLYSSVRQVAGMLSGQGIEVAEASYQQALGLFSAIPVGKNHIGDTPFTGLKTMRNMLPHTTACLWPALIKSKINGPILVGTDDNSALVTTGDDDLINPHELISGMSGSGKTVSELIELIRRLYTYPNTWVRFVDPQNLAAQIVKEVDGEVADMGPNGGIRYNFLWRFSLGGRPQALIDTYEVFTSTLALMMGRNLSDVESPTLDDQMVLLYQHFEGGKSLVRHLMQSLYYQYGQELGFYGDSTGASYYEFEDKLTHLYSQLRQRHNVPTNGFVVQPLLDPAGSGEVVKRRYPLSPDQTQAQAAAGVGTGVGVGVGVGGKSRSRPQSELGVALKMLNCVSSGAGAGTGAGAKPSASSATTTTNNNANTRRNLYAGGGYSEVEIPLAEWQDITGAVALQEAWGQLDNTAWTNFLLVRYLADPTNPRRAAGQAEWVWWDEEKGAVAHGLNAPRRMEQVSTGSDSNPAASGNPNATANSTATPTKKQPTERLRAKIPGATLKWESGPIWYSEEKWGTLLKADFWLSVDRMGLLDRLDEDRRQLAMRDLLVELSYGEPILSDILPLLRSAENNWGMLMALTLKKYCDPEKLGPLFNGYSNIGSNSRFLVFSVKDLSGSLLALRMMQCIELTWREIASTPRSAGRQYVIAWDELGTIMAQNGGDQVARYIGIMYKRSRALGGKIVCLEQNWQSFNTAAGQQIRDNSAIIKLMLQNNRQAADFWASMLSLTVEDRNRLLHTRPGEVLLLRNQGSKLSKSWALYRANKAQLEMLSTKRADRLKYQQRQRAALKLSSTQAMIADLLPDNALVKQAA